MDVYAFSIITEDGPREVEVKADTHQAALNTVTDKYPEAVVVGTRRWTVPDEEATDDADSDEEG